MRTRTAGAACLLYAGVISCGANGSHGSGQPSGISGTASGSSSAASGVQAGPAAGSSTGSAGSSGAASGVQGGPAAGSSTGSASTGASSGSSGGGSGSSSGAASGASGVDAGPIVAPQPTSANILVDQIGYRTADEKIAVIRNPKVGFDASKSFSPGSAYALVDAHSGAMMLQAAPKAWNGGATDTSSGDQVWHFDFSSVQAPGDYFVLDVSGGVRSPVFRVADDVYRDALVQTTRMYYYQRDGIAKLAQYAGAAWADSMEHPQDAMCGLYSDGSGPVDLHGGWFDAGDQNRYTNWAASDVIQLLHAYTENTPVFTDDTNIPESGNGVADLLDEIKWEIDWMVRMQASDGSARSIAAHAGASPPSADTSPCKYGPASTSASLSEAAAFAYASVVFQRAAGVSSVYPGFASDLATRAKNAWSWAMANPSVTFSNTAAGIGGGEQEVNAAGLALKKVVAAVYLFELTGDATYQSVVDGNYASLQSSFDASHLDTMDAALEYASVKGATAATAQALISNYKATAEAQFFPPHASGQDPYGAWVTGYWWGNNQTKASQGVLFTNFVAYSVDAAESATALTNAERYVHYVLGVNPLQLVYLSAMGGHGAEKFVTRFYHSWFAHGSDWDQAGVSKYGPPPGYLVGGANPGYTWDSCCPSGCGSAANNAACGSAQLSPPSGQPDEKSYLDFNDPWPLDSWSVSEPDLGYQAAWVRLLSRFVR